METATLHLDLTVDYTLNGVSTQRLQERVRTLINNAIQEGMLTGETEAEVDEWRMDTVINPTHQHDDIRSHLQGRLESGNLPAENLAEKLAEYGLMPVSDFLDEMQERGAINPIL